MNLVDPKIWIWFVPLFSAAGAESKRILLAGRQGRSGWGVESGWIHPSPHLRGALVCSTAQGSLARCQCETQLNNAAIHLAFSCKDHLDDTMILNNELLCPIGYMLKHCLLSMDHKPGRVMQGLKVVVPECADALQRMLMQSLVEGPRL